MIESKDKSVQGLFTDNKYVFIVPNYQRHYVWEQDAVQRFLDDCEYCMSTKMKSTQYQHYFGQVILRNRNANDRADRSFMEIVDGQQRLTTFTILVAVVYRKLVSLLETSDDTLKQSISSLLGALEKNYIFSVDNISDTKVRKLELSAQDNLLLEKIADMDTESSLPIDKPRNSIKSTVCIYKAYTLITSFIDERTKGKSSSQVFFYLNSFIDAVATQFRIVLLKADDRGYSYALYQIVNDRGVSLTTAELLKARTMELLDPNQALFNECEEVWNNILSDSGSETDAFLKKYYTATLLKSPSPTSLQVEYEKNIFCCFGERTLSAEGQNALCNNIKRLQKNIQYCRSLKQGLLPSEESGACNPQIENLYKNLVLRLKNDTSSLIVLNVLNHVPTRNRIRILENSIFFMSKFFFIAKTVCNIRAESIEKAYLIVAKSIQEGNFTVAAMQETFNRVLNQKQCYDSFNRWITEDIYSDSTTARTVFLLYFLEMFFADENDYTLTKFKRAGDDAMPMDFLSLSTEHILGRNVEDEDSELKDNVNRLGNLTLLGKMRNNALGDKSYTQKIVAYRNSPFAMTREVGANDDWSMREFGARQFKMVAKAKAVFRI